MKFTVKRSEWLRGEGGSESRLLRTRDGRRCCLGFLAQACDIPDSTLAGCTSPQSALFNQSWPDGILNGDMNTEATKQLMLVNDRPLDPEHERNRERDLTELFASIGITVEFVE